ncbi:hypothetical protein BJI46_01820 [Acinetobacter qingfengensis]|uniref:DUF4198 domain-containing protein n=2 Tax=Acinetobacter qingfengensis TaxID=1262585 RepID=A0A1E7RCW3_9GAMM|nr:hypothetical protein BJI46_01820 [Acinetobacter qingfengensis]
MKQLKQWMAVATLMTGASLAQAHSPFAAPQTYIVDGDTAVVIAGFAESPFASEFALSGFDFSVVQPTGEVVTLEAKGSKYLTAADVETKAEGTYKVIANRENKLEYALVNKQWLRIMDSHGQALPPLAERSFITPEELTAKHNKITSIRHEQLVSYFSKAKLTDQVLKPTAKGLEVNFSQHPNQLQAQQAVTLTVTIDGKVQSGFSVVASRQLTKVDEQEIVIKTTTNAQGQIQLNFPQAGQYFIEVNAPEIAKGTKPAAQNFRQNIAVQVN